MDYEIYSYRFSQEILEHPRYSQSITEIIDTIDQLPVYLYPNKSKNNSSLDIVQQLMNAYFDVQLTCNRHWLFHPHATNIPASSLKADFRKVFNGLKIHIEVQFGNMSRWYSDIFKFQTAYSQDLIEMGISIVPFKDMAKRIDSNVANYERCLRELPSANMSITLPILLIGLKIGTSTPIHNITTTQFNTIHDITDHGNTDNLFRIVNNIINGIQIQNIGPNSNIGSRP